MEKRVFLAIFLSFGVLYLYQSYMKPAAPPVRPAQTAQLPPANASGAATADAPSMAGGPAAPASDASPAAVTGDTVEREVVVENEVVRAVFSNRGAVLTSWTLKKYFNAGGKPLELIPRGIPDTSARPFELDAGDPQLNARLRNALYEQVDGAGASRLDVGAAPATLAFAYQDAAGLAVRKVFSFEPRSYIVRVAVDATLGDRKLDPAIQWGPALGDALESQTSRYVQKPQAIYFEGGKARRVSAADVVKQPRYQGQKYAGVDDQYFLSAAITGGSVAVAYEGLALPDAKNPKTPHELVAYQVKPAGGATTPFFVGPKDFDLLSAVDRDLVKVINYGMFDIIVVPLLRSLKYIHGFAGNYGWSIILLTVLINGIMFPLRHKSVVSMRKMQEVQPEVKAIQDRYEKLKASDPARQKMNVEIMNLYRERGVNPASGCIPMLLTFPVLLAFYSLLSQSIEIRGAPFMFWIKDLSMPDPFYVTPILMGATQVWQQRLAPAAGDPVQQKMMMVMPIVFTFMFLWAPSGLVLYWLVSNMWAIGQQYLTNRIIGPPVVRTVRPPAERRMKSVGSGKAEAVAKSE